MGAGARLRSRSRHDAPPRARSREDAVSSRDGVEGSVGTTQCIIQSCSRSFDRFIHALDRSIHSRIVANGRDANDGVDGDARARVYESAGAGRGIEGRWCASCGGEDARAGRAMGGGGGAGGALAGDAGRDAGGELAEGLGRVRGVARQTTAE